MLLLATLVSATATELFCSGVSTAITMYSIYRTGKKIKV
jgi:hypothetical protein